MSIPPARARLAAEVASISARTAGHKVIVLGSLPPEGRDLDLLVRRPERERIARSLSEAGLVANGSTFVRFGACSAYAVELIDAESYLPPKPLADLFKDALLLSDFAPLSQPSPQHALLILALLVAEERGLSDKRRARLNRILDADPVAWAKAREAAGAWGAKAALAQLERLATEGPPVGRELLRRARRHPVLRRTRARSRGQRGLLVSLSGIDGSGKSSQARVLTETLNELGIEAELIWNDLLGNFALDLVGRPVKGVLRLLGRGAEPMANYDDATPAASGSGPESQVGLKREVWSSFVTLSNALEQRVLALRALSRNRVVVFDRGPFDLAVRMEVIYGTRAERQRRIVELAAPRPQLAFFLDISPELSLERKDDVWSLRQLSAHARIYRALARRFGAIELDGRQPADELAAELAATVWRSLG